jgi:hypothetical protein
LGRLVPWLRLVRLPLAPTAAWDVVTAGALALAAAGLPLERYPLEAWGRAVLAALLVYGAGMAGNDLADRERDRVLAPDRPLPAGQIRPRAAALLVAVLAALALLVSGFVPRAREPVALALALALLYDFALKHRLVPGALAMGGVRMANASLLVWPLVVAGVAPWQALLGPLAIGLYSAAVLVWSSLEEGPSTARTWTARALAAAAFTLAGAVGAWVAGGLTLGVFLAVGAVSSLLFGRTPRPGPPKRQVLEMLLGLYFLGVCLASAASGQVGLLALALALAWIWVSQRLVRALRPRA